MRDARCEVDGGEDAAFLFGAGLLARRGEGLDRWGCIFRNRSRASTGIRCQLTSRRVRLSVMVPAVPRHATRRAVLARSQFALVHLSAGHPRERLDLGMLWFSRPRPQNVVVRIVCVPIGDIGGGAHGCDRSSPSIRSAAQSLNHTIVKNRSRELGSTEGLSRGINSLQARNGRDFSSSEAEEETVSSRNPRRGALPCYVTDPGTSAAWTPRDAARHLGGVRDVMKESKAESLCLPIWIEVAGFSH